jgi:hypothetical protein
VQSPPVGKSHPRHHCNAGFKRFQIAFLTAYSDRESAGFKKTVAGLAWNSFAWFVSEPDKIVIFRNGDRSASRLSNLVGI